MSLFALRDVEKIERFYLISCTDVPLSVAKSMHRSFPALNVNHFTNQPILNSSKKISRTKSKKSVKMVAPESEAMLHNNNRAKVAFLRMCDSLSCTVPDDSVQENVDSLPSLTSIETEDEDNIDVAVPSTMCKDEFIRKLDEGIFRKNDARDANENIDHRHSAKSDYVISKSKADPDNAVTNQKNHTKSTSCIKDATPNEESLFCSSLVPQTAASKVIFTGIFLFIILGLAKNIRSDN